MGDSLLQDPRVLRARDFLREQDDWILELQKELTGIPAPPYGEGPRGQRMKVLFREVGLQEVARDKAGNILGSTSGASRAAPRLLVSAHLDTVFPEGTDVTPSVDGDRIYAPGIADDGRGLAVLLALARLATSLPPPSLPPLLFVATVGEEGAGNLRGVRHLFREDGPGRKVGGFISLDGVGLDRVINEGVGSTRLRVTLKGPGGHSWTDWDLPNPIHFLGKILAAMDTLPLPSRPRTTATVARCGGGKSINAIPQEAWMEVDLRSQGSGELERVEEALLSACRRILGGDGRESEAGLSLELEELGRRPAGSTDSGEPLVQAALAATRSLGVEPKLVASSTDANIPMSMGIPAITLGAGGRAGGIHTLNEWYSNEEGPEGAFRALLTLLVWGEVADQPTSE